jgi:hypothetical protein
MSFLKAALGALAPQFFTASTRPIPTEEQLNGYPHIVGATHHLIKISSDDDQRILTPLKEALITINTPESEILASRFGKSPCSSSINNLHIPYNEPNIRVLRKTALADIRAYCQDIVQTCPDAPEHIKQPIHGFLNHFPAAILHPVFTRPRGTQPLSRCGPGFFPA